MRTCQFRFHPLPFILSGAEFIAERSRRGDDEYHSLLA